MHLILFNESFFFCPRSDLESLQLVRRSLLNVIVAGSNVLPLRPIGRVDMGYGSEDKVRISVEEPTVADESEPDYEASVNDGNFADTFHRLQHTCIKVFCVGIRDSPFLRYWKAQEADAFTVVSIDFLLLGTTDYALLDSIVCGDAFPPPAFFLNEPVYANYELSYRECKAADGIDGLIESFIRDGCANKKIQSVGVQWMEEYDGPQSPALKQLSMPTKTDMPLPKNDYAWIARDVHRVTQCDAHSFVNAKQWKRMDVYKCTAEYQFFDENRTAHILYCRMEDL